VANYVFPKGKLERETLKIARRIANVDLELLSLSKRVVNRTFDQMGFSVSCNTGRSLTVLAIFYRMQSVRLKRSAARKG